MKAEKDLRAVSGEEQVKKCPDCGSKDIEYQGGEHYCKKCGLVID